MTKRGDPRPPIRFAALAAALLARAGALVPAWLPGGVQRGHEYICGSLQGGSGDSCAVNLNTGKWGDFATDDRGNDLIDLYAAINGFSRQEMGKAAVQLAREEGLEDVAGVQPAPAGAGAPPPRPPPPPAPPAKPRSEPEGWRTCIPVPPNAPAATFRHQFRAPEDIQHKAEYRVDGFLMGYVVRFGTSTGGKETLPYTWCTSERDGASKWHWKQWDEPRPLFFPAGQSPRGKAGRLSTPPADGPLPTVVLVEGERKAEVLQAALDACAPGIYLVVSWPGGCKSWRKAAWAWLEGCTVLAWPDCDSKREPLKKAEREQYADDLALEVAQAAKPFLLEHKQPGMAAMLGIGADLRDVHGCTVSLLPIPKPGIVVDGWDCANAIEDDGWDGERILEFFGRAQPLPDIAGEDARAGGSGGAGGDGGGGKKIDRLAEAGDGDDAFQDYLDFVCGELKIKVHELGITRKLLIAALRKAPELKDCLVFNELTGSPYAREAWPWRDEAGPLNDNDDLRLIDYLSTKYKLKAASRASSSEAIDTVADERRWHPVRSWLQGLTHDRTTRIDKWLMFVTGKDPARLRPRQRRYFELVGRFLLMGLVARVMNPGCKFDYSPVFEGLTGKGKSTLVAELVGADFFSDTHFDIGNGKDGMEQLEGLWAYELSEMTAFRRADNEQVKQFFSSRVDRFRGAYGKFVQKHPRQCLIICTTNKRQYLYDLTGNRRFWPIWIDQAIKLNWIRKFRGQLFAEAYALYMAGERYAPTPEEELEFFVPEQRKRLAETAVQSKLYDLLTREGAGNAEGELSSKINQLTTFVTLDKLVQVLGADAAKSSAMLEGQIRSWLEAHGWKYGRESTGQRRYGFKQPKIWPPKLDDLEDHEEDEKPPEEDAPDGESPPAQGEDNGGDDYAEF